MEHIIRGAKPKIEVVSPEDCGTEISDIDFSRRIAFVLMAVYPRYHWLVNTDGKNGVVTIRCGEINAEVNANRLPGMVLHLKNLSDYSIARRKIVMAAGELLERANLKRGPWDGQTVKKVDGLKPQHQPRSL